MNQTVISFVIVLLLEISPLLAVDASQTGMVRQVGAASIDITPDFAVRLSGYGNRREPHDSVAQRIFAKALAIGSDEEGPAVLVTVDNCGVPASIRDEVLKRLAKDTRVQGDHLAIASSHTHCAPMLIGVLPNLFSMDIPAEHLPAIERYTSELTDRIEQVARQALADRQPSTLAWGVGSVGFASNRRKFPLQPVDHDLPVLRVLRQDGSLRAIFTSYACHCTTLAINEIHGDWAGCAQEALQREFPGAIALTAVGCGADQNPNPRRTMELVRQYGESLAAEAKRLASGQLQPVNGPLHCTSKAIELAFDTLPTREKWRELADSPSAPIAYHAKKNLARLEAGEALPTTLPYLVQSWTFGDDLAIVFLPGEVVVDYSHRIKGEFDRSRIWVNAYCNDVPCYIPSRRVLEEGGYEGGSAMVYYDRPTKFAPDVEERIMEAVHEVVPQTFLPRETTVRQASAPVSLPDKASVQIFLLLGQSNMAGRGDVEPQDRIPDPRVLMLDRDGNFSPAVDPMHFDKPVAGVGMGRAFGFRIADARPGTTIGLVPCAVGGSPIDSWRPGEFYQPTKSHPWDDAIARAKIAMQSGELKGILWHQGESDSRGELSAEYQAKLDDLVQRLRKELGTPEVPFLVGQLGKFADTPWNEDKKRVDAAHRSLPSRQKYTAFVSSEGLRHKGDQVHFDSASLRELGKRYAEAYLQLGQTPAEEHLGDANSDAVASNIVLMYVDNLGYGDLGCYSNTEILSPRLDGLAKEGVRCTDFYVVTATCTPSRGALLTGRHPKRNGLTHQLVTSENWTGIGLPHRERILPQYLKDSGYVTACFGKWNIGFAEGSRPTERGFDEFLGCRSGNIHYFRHTYHGEYDIFRGTEPYRVEGYSTDIFADAACEFIRRHAQQPFFVYVPFNAPHYVSAVNTAPNADEKPQWHVPGKYLERYGWPADDQTEKHRYLALLTAMDDAVGRVLDTLDDCGQRDRTLVIFLSDMGAILRPTHGLGVASNAPFRGGAPELYEGGIRVPAIFRWPGRIEPGTECREVLTHLDLLPLCLLAAGSEPVQERVLDGRNPLPALNGGPSPHSRMIATIGNAAALREKRWKIHRTSPAKPWELYDLDADPAESHDLAAAHPEEVKRLSVAFEQWEEAVQEDASPPAPRPPRAKK